jgi:hypothetical protein
MPFVSSQFENAVKTILNEQRLDELSKDTNSLDEGKMSELAMDIGDHMDKHISTYKKQGGSEALMGHADTTSHKIAKMHNIAHEHAKKFVKIGRASCRERV